MSDASPIDPASPDAPSDASATPAAWRGRWPLGLGAALLTLGVAWLVAADGPTAPPELVLASSLAIAWTGSFAVAHLLAPERSWLWLPALAAFCAAACVCVTASRETGGAALIVATPALALASFGATHAAEATGRPTKRWWTASVVLTLLTLLGTGALVLWAIAHSGFGGG